MKNKGGRPKKLTNLEEIALYNEYKSGEIDITTLAFNYKVSYRTVNRIVKKHKSEFSEEDHDSSTNKEH